MQDNNSLFLFQIKTKAREVFASSGIKDIKFSDGWLQKFCKRSNIKIRHNSDDRLLLWILAQFDNNVSLSHQQITEKSSVLVGKMKEFKVFYIFLVFFSSMEYKKLNKVFCGHRALKVGL